MCCANTENIQATSSSRAFPGRHNNMPKPREGLRHTFPMTWNNVPEVVWNVSNIGKQLNVEASKYVDRLFELCVLGGF